MDKKSLKRKTRKPNARETTEEAQARGKRVREAMHVPTPLPTSIRVGFRHYTVIKWDQTDSFMTGSMGDHCSLQCKIRIANGLNPAQTANTLLHEVFHACYHYAELMDKDGEERIVSGMSNVLCQVWQDNPELIAFLDAALGQRK